MIELSSYERMKRTYEHKPIDKVPMIDVPWTSALLRWKKEGMPETADFMEYFGLDKICKFEVDNSPRYPAEVIGRQGEYKIYTTNWGGTVKESLERVSSIEFEKYQICDWDSWRKAKERITPDPDRIPWDLLSKNYKKWRDEGYWVRGRLWFGFDVTRSWVMGTVDSLYALMDEPELLSDMYNTQLDTCLALLDTVWDKGYTFDEVSWDEDMGYKNAQFFSVQTYRDIIKPVHKRAIDWAHKKGIFTHMHSCGNIIPLIPELLDIGLDALNPLEVKAGMQPEKIKAEFGERLMLRGGFDPQFWNNQPETEALIKQRLPVMMEGSGYLFSSDHSIPDTVSLDDYRNVVKTVKTVGKY